MASADLRAQLRAATLAKSLSEPQVQLGQAMLACDRWQSSGSNIKKARRALKKGEFLPCAACRHGPCPLLVSVRAVQISLECLHDLSTKKRGLRILSG